MSQDGMMSRLRSWFGADPRPEPEPLAAPDPSEGVDELRGWLSAEVAAGFHDADEISEAAGDYFEGTLDADVVQAGTERLLPQLLAAHAREQQAWPAVTDNDRLEAAFGELEDAGIVCRENFTCCNNCGSTEIWAEVEDAREVHPGVRGYIFYHMQDTERAVAGGGIYLSYGAVSDAKDAPLAIARDVVSTLTRHGLRTEWSGDAGQRIRVDLDWKRRRAA